MQAVKKRHPKGKGAWYFITRYECPLCGKSEEFRERRYGQRPKPYGKRHEYNLTSGCWGHFL